MATSLQERLKLKQYQVDTWTPREQLCLASAVMRSGDQNWVAVSRTIKTLTTETNRPLDWYSTKNCALMYAKLLEKVDTPKRKREKGEPTNTNETPGEIVTKMLAKQRTEELRVLEAQSRTSYNHLRQQIQHLEARMLDHTLDAEWEALVRERKEEEEKERLHHEWLKQREEKIHAIQKALKHQIPKVPISASTSSSLNKKNPAGLHSWHSTSSSERRDSGMSDNSELDLALDSPGVSSPMVEESQLVETETKTIPTSPLLSSLLSKPPNPPNSSNVATDLRQSFNLASSRGRVGLSPNVSSALQNLVSSAISGTDATQREQQKATSTSPGSAAPTLSRLLELPPRPPGDPMPSITDLPPTHAETMAQVHKRPPPDLKKPRLDIEALAAEAAESLLSDSLLNDLDDQLDDEEMDEDEEGKKEEELSSVSVTPPEACSQEGGKTRDHKGLEMSEADVKGSTKLLDGKSDPPKCGEGSSPETDVDVPLEEDKKGEEPEQVGDKRKQEEEEKEVREKLKSSNTQNVEQELIDKEKMSEKEIEEFYKIKKVVVEIKDIMKDKKGENMIFFNSEEKLDEKCEEINKETKNETENNNLDGEKSGKCGENSKDENVNLVENVKKGSIEKSSRKIEGDHKKKSEGREDERNKHKRSDKKKDRRNEKEHKKSKKNKKDKHKEKTESEKDESEKESKDKERRSEKEKSKNRKGEKERDKKEKEKHKVSRSDRDKHKDKKEGEKDDKYKKVTKYDKDDKADEKKRDKYKSKRESEKSKNKGEENKSKTENDKEKAIEESSDQQKERKSKSKKTIDVQGETNNDVKLDKTKKKEVEKEMGNYTEDLKENEKQDRSDKKQSSKLSEKDLEKKSAGLDNINDASDVVKTEDIQSSISYADKVKTGKKTIEESNITDDMEDSNKNINKIEPIGKDKFTDINLESNKVEDHESISMDQEMESKENNFNISNTDCTENVWHKSYKPQVTEQNDSKENMKVLNSIINPKVEEKQNMSSEVKVNKKKATPGDKDEDMTDNLDDMNLMERKKKISSSGFGKADVFLAEDSPMNDSEQAEDIKDMDEDSMDALQAKKGQEDITDPIIKNRTEATKLDFELKHEKLETELSSFNISSESLQKDFVHENRIKRDEKEKKEDELEEILSKMDEEEKDKKENKIIDLEDEFINEDSRDIMTEDDMVHARGGKRKSSGSDLFAVASPFVPESNPCSPASTYYGDENDAEKAYRAWKKPIMILWNEIAAHKYASVFLRPITDEQAPGYHDVVHRPMDLKSIKARIENGTITNTSEFQRDIMLMFLNATMYNTADHNVHQMATRMMKDIVASIEEFRTTQMLARASDTPVKSLRRETRESSAKRGDDDPKRKGFDTPDDKNIKKRRL